MLLIQVKGDPRPAAVRSLLKPESASKLGVEEGRYLGDLRSRRSRRSRRSVGIDMYPLTL